MQSSLRLVNLPASILFGAAVLLSACGDDDGGGGNDGGSSGSGSPLSNLLSGFGPPGTGGPTGPAMSGDGGAPRDGDAGAEPEAGGEITPAGSDTNCGRLCERVAECMPVGGCPNFGLLSAEVQQKTIDDCESTCGVVTDEQMAAVEGYTCDQVAGELLNDPEVAAFCALTPASEADCQRFCTQLADCGYPLTDTQCEGACFNGGAVTCVLENKCNFPACAQYFQE